MAAVKDKLTIRERVGLELILIALMIVKPVDYSHEISKYMEDIKAMLKVNE